MDLLIDETLSANDSTIDSFSDLKISDNCKDFRSERVNKLGFEPQKEIVYNRYLPYNDQLDEECVQYLALIKANIGRTLVLNDKHGFQWISDLSKYLRLYGQTFSKEDHIYFINTLYEVIIIPGLELNRVAHYANVMSTLLKKRELITRDDLTIDWRPLYELFERTLFSPFENLGMFFIPDNYESALKNLIRSSRPYFSVHSTQEMLDEWRPLLCPYDTVILKATAYLELFLPTLIPPEHHDKGFKLWFEELMFLWKSSQNTPSWEQNLIALFARLANDTIGYIQWNPHIPQIFTHLIRSFNLMGGQHKVQITRGYSVFNINSVVLWLVAMLGPNSDCQRHVTKLFKAVESYYHPSNTGKWNLKLQQLLFKLPASFISRIHRERYKKPSWRTPVPEDRKLTEKDIDEFVDSMVNVVMISMFSRFGSAESAQALQSLSLLRPEKVIPPVLENMYSALETLTEPHRLSASMQCVVSVARTLVKANKYYPEGPTHVLPLLVSSLDGLDVNDMKKCMVTFQFIATFVTLIPIIDCSSAVDLRNDLTETEIQLCLATARFEDFVLQFMDRCFVLIENSSLEQISRLDQDNDQSRMNTEEGIIEVGLASTFGSILLQCSPQILESAIDKLYLFVSSHIFETKVAGKFAAILVRSCSKANAELSLRKFLPHFCKLVLTLTESDDILNEEFLDHELLFSLQIISELVRCDGKHLVKYKDIIVSVLDRTLHLKCRKGHLLSSVILKHVLKSLTLLCALDFRSIAKSWEEYGNFEKDLPIRDWGCTMDVHHLNVKWHDPSEDELAFAQQLLEQFLRSELNDLENWTKGEKCLTREDVQRSLLIISDCISGAASALPLWSGQNILLYESLIPTNTSIVNSVGSKIVNFSNNENIREAVLKTLRSTLVYLNNSCEDDTKSLCRLIKIFNNSMFFWGVTKNDFDTRWKGFQVVKKALGNKLTLKKEHIRALMIDRLVLQHEMRLMNKSMTKFTELHQSLMKDLILLATSHYSEVRCQAQDTLFNCFRSFPFSYRVTLPDVIKFLSKDEDSTHEQFKGSLYVILGQKGSSLLTARDWSTLNLLWPSIVNAKHSEKPSIIRLIDFEITGHVRKAFDTLALSVDIPDRCVEVAKTVWTRNRSQPKPAFDCPTDQEIKNGLQIAQKRNETNIDLYKDLIEKLVALMDGSNLHWRYYQLSYVLLSMLIRHDMNLPVSAVKLFTKNLIHDTLYIRKISISSFSAILKQMKPKHHKKEVKPTPTDNTWLQTDTSIVIDNEQDFNSFNFVDKPHIGFYCYPKPFLVYDISLNRLNNDNLSESQLIVYNSFTDTQFLEQFLSYLSLEENKGKDKFSSRRFQLWKGLFRNFGPFNLQYLMPKIGDFVTGIQESAHRCAAEFIAGCVRGSKHWSFEDFTAMKTYLEPVMVKMFENITTETLSDWGTCSATMFENRDARRLSWILKIFSDDPLKAGAEVLSSFLQASRLYLLHGAVQQQEWRSQKVLNQLLTYLEDNHLTHSYQNVRERIGSLLCNIFMFDVAIPSLPHTFDLSPKRSPFIDKIIPRLEVLLTQNNENQKEDQKTDNVLNGFSSQSPERKDAGNLLKTISKWIVGNVPRVAYSAPPEMFQFLPILCQMQSETSDEELVRESFFAIIMLSHALLTPESIEMAIKTSKQVCALANWHARSAIATFLQYMVSSNLFVLMNNPLWVNDITQMILELLSDERTEVRESTAETLSGLMHCEFVKIDKTLIKYFETKSNHKLNKMENKGKVIVDPKDLTLRHSGILGLCACINAFPYDVPDFMPDILVFLSNHMNDPQPIPTAIKKTLSNFRRTHLDSWRDHKLKFTDDQLYVITGLLVSPNYYA